MPDNQPCVTIAKDTRCPAFSHELGRVNVILGSNGTGKSSLMRKLNEAIGPWVAARAINIITPIHGNRTLYSTSKSQRSRAELARYDKYLKHLFLNEDYDQKSLERASDSMLEALCQGHLKTVQEHSSACENWKGGGQIGAMPDRQQSSLDRFIHLFTHIFPDITLAFNLHEVSVQCQQKGECYETKDLSSGEKQVFMLLGKFVNKDRPECFLIDEPDRNLNPRLAERFWSAVEDWHHPNSVFVYATHLPSFALRTNVDRVFLLDGEDSKEIDGADGFVQLPADQRIEFLGAIPSIVVRDKVLVVEGEEGGIDKEFYTYLLGDDSIAVVPVADCYQVRNAVNGAGPWYKVTTGVRMVGVIDRDYRSDDQLLKLSRDNLISLPFHEIEGILCMPEILEALLNSKYHASNRPPLERLINSMRDCAIAHLVPLAVRRTKEVLCSRLRSSDKTSETH